jgi:hypothetical protein
VELIDDTLRTLAIFGSAARGSDHPGRARRHTGAATCFPDP